MDTVTKSAESSDRRRQISFERWKISRLLHIKYSLGAPLLGSVSGSPSQAVWTSTHIKNTKEVITCMSAVSKKEISAVWLLTFCSHFPSAHLVSIWLEVIIISYISQHSTRQPLENRRELVASSWVMYTVHVGRGSNNNRDSKSQRAEFFHSRKKMSHTPTHNTLSLVARCCWRNGHLCFFFALSRHVLLLVYDGEPISTTITLDFWRMYGGRKWFVSISTKITKITTNFLMILVNHFIKNQAKLITIVVYY